MVGRGVTACARPVAAVGMARRSRSWDAGSRRTGTAMAAGTSIATAASAGCGRPSPLPPMTRPGRMIQLEQDLLAKNNAFAAENRKRWVEQGVFVLNLVSSPGSGKTTLLTATIERLKDRLAMAVVEGDQQTTFDADRIRATGIPAIQINTGKGCHLDAHMVGHAAEELGTRPGLRAPDRERRQPRLPGRVRPGRSPQGGDPLGHRRGGQTPQIPGHVRGRGCDDPQQDRPASLCAFRRGAVPCTCPASSIPASR